MTATWASSWETWTGCQWRPHLWHSRLRLALVTFLHGPMCPRCEARHWRIAESVCAANVAACDGERADLMLASGRIGGPV